MNVLLPKWHVKKVFTFAEVSKLSAFFIHNVYTRVFCYTTTLQLPLYISKKKKKTFASSKSVLIYSFFYFWKNMASGWRIDGVIFGNVLIASVRRITRFGRIRKTWRGVLFVTKHFARQRLYELVIFSARNSFQIFCNFRQTRPDKFSIWKEIFFSVKRISFFFFIFGNIFFVLYAFKRIICTARRSWKNIDLIAEKTRWMLFQDDYTLKGIFRNMFRVVFFV